MVVTLATRSEIDSLYNSLPKCSIHRSQCTHNRSGIWSKCKVSGFYRDGSKSSFLQPLMWQCGHLLTLLKPHHWHSLHNMLMTCNMFVTSVWLITELLECILFCRSCSWILRCYQSKVLVKLYVASTRCSSSCVSCPLNLTPWNFFFHSLLSLLPS